MRARSGLEIEVSIPYPRILDSNWTVLAVELK